MPGVDCESWATKVRKPTPRQIYALAVVLCEQGDERFPETRDAASELIERLRLEKGDAASRLEERPAEGAPIR